jgi:hypothetical protein
MHDDCLQRKLHGFGATACGIQASSHMDMMTGRLASRTRPPHTHASLPRERSPLANAQVILGFHTKQALPVPTSITASSNGSSLFTYLPANTNILMCMISEGCQRLGFPDKWQKYMLVIPVYRAFTCKWNGHHCLWFKFFGLPILATLCVPRVPAFG